MNERLVPKRRDASGKWHRIDSPEWQSPFLRRRCQGCGKVYTKVKDIHADNLLCGKCRGEGVE